MGNYGLIPARTDPSLLDISQIRRRLCNPGPWSLEKERYQEKGRMQKEKRYREKSEKDTQTLEDRQGKTRRELSSSIRAVQRAQEKI